MVEAIIFDAGGVLLKGSIKRFLDRCREELGLSPIKNIEQDGGAVFGFEMQTGVKSPAETFSELFGNPEKELLKKVLKLNEAEWPQDPEMVEFAKSLKPRYKIGLLSNTDELHSTLWRKNGFTNLFDAVVLSNEVHLVKPDKRIYLLMLEKIGLKAGQCVFVDDIKDCIEAAKKLGFKTVRFSGKSQLENELKGLGVEF